MSADQPFPAPEPDSEAARFERSKNPRHQLRENLGRLYGGSWQLVREPNDDVHLTWSIDEGSEREGSIAWRTDQLTGHAYLQSDERGDRAGFSPHDEPPIMTPCPTRCPLSHRSAHTDRVPILAMPGSRMRDGLGDECVLRHASARLNLFPYLPDACLITPIGEHHGRPATWPAEAMAEALLIAGTLERQASSSPRVLGIDVFQNLGYEAFGSQDHPHIQVVPRPIGLLWPDAWVVPRNPQDEVVHRRGAIEVLLRRPLGDPWIRVAGCRGLRELSWEDHRHLADLWRRIDLAYHQASCDHLNVLFLIPPFAADGGELGVVFVARERGWARGRAGFELLERDQVWVTGRDPRSLADHFRRAVSDA